MDVQGRDERQPDEPAGPPAQRPVPEDPARELPAHELPTHEPPAPEPSARELSVRDRAVLDVASRPWPGAGARDRAIRERLGMSPTAYLQLLNALLDDPRALAYAPVTVNRLRATREARRHGRM